MTVAFSDPECALPPSGRCFVNGWKKVTARVSAVSAPRYLAARFCQRGRESHPVWQSSRVRSPACALLSGGHALFQDLFLGLFVTSSP